MGGSLQQEMVNKAMDHERLVTEDTHPGFDGHQGIAIVSDAIGGIFQQSDLHAAPPLCVRGEGDLGPVEDLAEREYEDMDVLPEPAGAISTWYEQDNPALPPIHRIAGPMFFHKIFNGRKHVCEDGRQGDTDGITDVLSTYPSLLYESATISWDSRLVRGMYTGGFRDVQHDFWPMSYSSLTQNTLFCILSTPQTRSYH